MYYKFISYFIISKLITENILTSQGYMKHSQKLIQITCMGNNTVKTEINGEE